MRTKKVVVLPYDRIWKSDFEEIKREIEGAIGDLMIGIEHVGSTSVEGMSAKPIIDIDVIIQDYAVFDAVVRRLEAIGYVHEGNLGINDKKAACLIPDKRLRSFSPEAQSHNLHLAYPDMSMLRTAVLLTAEDGFIRIFTGKDEVLHDGDSFLLVSGDSIARKTGLVIQLVVKLRSIERRTPA